MSFKWKTSHSATSLDFKRLLYGIMELLMSSQTQIKDKLNRMIIVVVSHDQKYLRHNSNKNKNKLLYNSKRLLRRRRVVGSYYLRSSYEH
jgi:competence transcription factor ComK